VARSEGFGFNIDAGIFTNSVDLHAGQRLPSRPAAMRDISDDPQITAALLRIFRQVTEK
jgi:hypothetical protein